MQTEAITITKKKRIGIYSIVHIESGRTYIGSSKDIDARLTAHIQRLGKMFILIIDCNELIIEME